MKVVNKDFNDVLISAERYLSKKESLYALICVFLVAIHVWLELKVPDYMSAITRLVQTEGSLMSDILKQGGFMLACAFISLICNIVVGYFAAIVSSNFSSTLRSKVYEKVQKTIDIVLK